MLLEIKNLHISLPSPSGMIHVVRGVDLALQQGEIFGLAGESGCGKTLTSLSIIGLTPPNAQIRADTMQLGDQDLRQCDWRRIRGQRVAMIFQDASAALNPVFSIASQLRAVLDANRRFKRAEIQQRSLALLEDVGLPDPSRLLHMYPHQLSGGMQQRVMIALALASGAELLLADEPTTALDVTIQAQMLALLRRLRSQHRLTILLISHDIGVLAQTCDRVAILYAGRIVESGPVIQLIEQAQHPYTRALLKAIPYPGSHGHLLEAITGSPPPPATNAVSGCAFMPRCRYALPCCQSDTPELLERRPMHLVACHRNDDHDSAPA